MVNEAPNSQKKTLPMLVQHNWVCWALGSLAEMRQGIDQALALGASTDLLIQDGLWKLKTGNPAGGHAALQKALQIDPGDLRALAVLTNSYFEQKQGATAVQIVKAYAASQPQSAAAQEFFGTLLMASGDHGQARAVLTAAKALDPQSLSTQLSLVQLDAVQGKWNDARTRLQTILAVQESSLVRLWLGNVEEITSNHGAAMDHFRKVVANDSANVQALNNLAYLLLEHANQADEALKYAEQAAVLAPDDPDVADTLGWVFYRKGLYSMAVKHLEAAARKDSVIPMYHLAMAYAKANDDPARARATLHAALKKNPHLPEARVAQDLVSQLKNGLNAPLQ